MPFSSLELHLPSLYLAGLGFLLSTNLNKVLGTGSWGWEWSSPGIDAEMDKTIFQARSGRASTSEQHRHKRLDTIGILRNSSRPKPLLLNFGYPTNMLCVFSLVGHYSLHMRRPCSSTWMRTVAATWRSRNSRRAMLSCKYSSWSRTGCHKHWNMLGKLMWDIWYTCYTMSLWRLQTVQDFQLPKLAGHLHRAVFLRRNLSTRPALAPHQYSMVKLQIQAS